MNISLSVDAEAFIAKLIADGAFENRDAVIERGIASFRAELGEIPLAPAEHMAAVEAAFDDLEKNGGVELTPEVVERMKSRASAGAAAARTRAAS